MVELTENSVVLTGDASANFLRHVFCRDDDNHLSQPQPYFFDDIQIHELDDGFSVNIEGLEILEKEEIHLAIIDIMMPRMDGIRMTMIMLFFPSRNPIVLFQAHFAIRKSR